MMLFHRSLSKSFPIPATLVKQQQQQQQQWRYNNTLFKRMLFPLAAVSKRWHGDDTQDTKGKNIRMNEIPHSVRDNKEGIKEPDLKSYLDPSRFVQDPRVNGKKFKVDPERLNEYKKRIKAFKDREDKVEGLSKILDELMAENLMLDREIAELLDNIIMKEISGKDIAALFTNQPAEKEKETITKKLTQNEVERIVKSRLKC